MNKLINKNIFIAIFLVIIISFHINYGTFNIESIIISSSLALKGKYEFRNKSYPVNDYPINKELFQKKLVQFIQEISLVKGINIAVLTQLKYETGGFITLGNRFPLLINKNSIKDIESYALYLEAKYIVLENWYKDVNYYNIVFNYCIITETDSKVLIQREKVVSLNKDELLNSEELKGLPLNQLYKTWAKKVEIINTNTFKVFIDGKPLFLIVKTEDNNTIIEVYNTKNILISMFIDKNINSREFIRYIDGKEYYIKDGKIFFYYQTKFSKMNYISKLSPMQYIDISNNTITLDIETYKDVNGDLQLYCIGIFDGSNKHSYHILDYLNINDLLSSVFDEILRRKNNFKNIYIHNGSEFDLIYLLKYLANIDGIRIKKPLIKDGKFINIPIEYGHNYQYKIYIKDSLLLLPHKLKDLAVTFGAQQQKLDFDHTKINSSNLLEFKDESIKYCIADCVALFQLLQIFNQEIYNLFKINITESPTLPSLAFRIFRTHFMGKIKIPILNGLIFKDISNSYYGGHVDMYIPESIKGKNVYIYDVNALYPTAMFYNQYPTKLISYFVGNISIMSELNKINPLKSNDTLGFFKVEVTAPPLLNPILPFKTDNTTVYGEGSWTAWYSTDEIKNAISCGYKFNILAGYIFKKENIFTKYVEILNTMKTEATRNSPKYIIAKLLMNTLYGRFGMSPNLGKSIVIKSIDFNDFKNTVGIENILETINLDTKLLVTIHEDFVNDSNINVSIASAVAANGRVHMTQFMNKPELTGILYYMDTDSAFISKELPTNMVNNTMLGYMKLENIFTKFISLGPKAYGGITINGEEIIKVKGLKSANDLSLSDLKFRLYENFDEKLLNNKNFKSMFKATIKTKKVSYFLKPTANKRELIFSNGNLVGTKNKVIKKD
jgi:DNA polymerase type B, organellar and viral/RNase_H superfamily